jgi:hypothetical protein
MYPTSRHELPVVFNKIWVAAMLISILGDFLLQGVYIPTSDCLEDVPLGKATFVHLDSGEGISPIILRRAGVAHDGAKW